MSQPREPLKSIYCFDYNQKQFNLISLLQIKDSTSPYNIIYRPPKQMCLRTTVVAVSVCYTFLTLLQKRVYLFAVYKKH